MSNSAQKHIFFVDDDLQMCKSACNTLKQNGFRVSCFDCAEDCIKKLPYDSCNLLITDEVMPGMSGTELLIEAKRIVPFLPVIVITGYADVPMVIRAMKAGASDFIEKPFDRRNLLLAVEYVLKLSAWSHQNLHELFTDTEVLILRYILDGKSTKEIAAVRKRAKSTIEDHRNNIYKKIDVPNLGGLFKWASKRGLI